VLPAKYHFHTNVAHYHQEVREKGEGDASIEDPMGAIVNPYSPLPDSAPLLRVPYTCPLFDITKVCSSLAALCTCIAHSQRR
jgi:hypothetical protein